MDNRAAVILSQYRAQTANSNTPIVARIMLRAAAEKATANRPAMVDFDAIMWCRERMGNPAVKARGLKEGLVST